MQFTLNQYYQLPSKVNSVFYIKPVLPFTFTITIHPSIHPFIHLNIIYVHYTCVWQPCLKRYIEITVYLVHCIRDNSVFSELIFVLQVVLMLSHTAKKNFFFSSFRRSSLCWCTLRSSSQVVLLLRCAAIRCANSPHLITILPNYILHFI